MIACFKCGKGMAEFITLFRENEKGVDGIWACLEHRTKPADPELDELVAVIENKPKEPS